MAPVEYLSQMTSQRNGNSVVDMDEEQFRLWQALIESRTGMAVAPERKQFLITNLGLRMRELGYGDYEEYYERLLASTPSKAVQEWSVLVDRLTVQETSFFRHKASYQLVDDYLHERVLQDDKLKTFNVWSVGCSTGEEPYSLAMLLNECFLGRNMKTSWGVMATDISLPALSKAREGRYPKRRAQFVDDSLMSKYFEESGKNHMQVVPALRERIAFSRINVVDLAKAPMQGLDVIFCQNMLIYFKRWRKRDIVNRLADRLALGGIMVLGLGEVVDWSHPHLERIDMPDTLAFKRVRNG